MTPAELQHEFEVTVDTRLGELCGTGDVSDEQRSFAEREATEHIKRLQNQDFLFQMP